MKSLLQINTVVNSGSTGRIAEEIGNLAIENGWNSYIAYGRNERPSKSNLIRIGTDLDVKLHGLKTRLFDQHGLGSVNATRKLVNQIKQINPDIIHLHNIHGYYINIEILFSYLANANIPVVWTLHDCWPFTGHCTHFEFIGCEKWKTECYACPQSKEYPASLFSDNSRQNYSIKKQLFNSVRNLTIIPVSDWLKNLINYSFLSQFVGPVIKNGIDIETFKIKDTSELRVKLNLNNYFLILGVTNVWSQRKGLNDFIELSKRIPDDCKIILVGLTVKQIKKLPLNILGISRTENTEQLASFYSMSDLFVNLTYEDNFPSTNLEALACGTPVITYKTGGSVESVNYNTGFVVKQGDTSGILEAIELVKKRKKTFYTENCRQEAENCFNKDFSFRKYMDLYHQLT